MQAGGAAAFAVIVAADERGGIGLDGDLPWKLPPDLQRFRRLTVGEGSNAVIMGRRTWESLPPSFRPLPQRLNVVVSRRAHLKLPVGARHACSLDHALDLARACDQVFVIGGGELYRAALAEPSCSVVHLTRVHGDFCCDTFFPEMGAEWLCQDQGAWQQHQDLRYRFSEYRRQDQP